VSIAWVYLLIAGLFEVAWAAAMKQSAGFTKLWPTLTMAGAMLASFALLSIAMRSLPLGTAYAVWTGTGAVGAFAVGIAANGEPVTVPRLAACGLIVAGLVLMKLSSPS
jgi:quaternary ammonium compound-resistance protein SugE